jgi:hypothetical protein
MAVWITQEAWDEIRALVKNIKVYGGFVQYFGRGASAGINIVVPQNRGGGGSSKSPRAAEITDGSGVDYSVSYLDVSSGGLSGDSGKAMPLQLNFFYPVPPGTEVVVVPLTIKGSGDGAGV